MSDAPAVVTWVLSLVAIAASVWSVVVSHAANQLTRAANDMRQATSDGAREAARERMIVARARLDRIPFLPQA